MQSRFNCGKNILANLAQRPTEPMQSDDAGVVIIIIIVVMCTVRLLTCLDIVGAIDFICGVYMYIHLHICSSSVWYMRDLVGIFHARFSRASRSL